MRCLASLERAPDGTLISPCYAVSKILVLSAATMTPSMRPYLLVVADCKDERAILSRKNYVV
jgi:hypothetical protein